MKFLIATNHSYMLWRFRKELIQELQKKGEVVISMPFVGHEDDFARIGCKCFNIDIERRGMNPLKDVKLISEYKKLLRQEKPDMVITYSIKPNVYMGFACRCFHIPYCVNVQGLGTAFQKSTTAAIASALYKIGIKKAKAVFFENKADAAVFKDRKITRDDKEVVLNGAGINTDTFPYEDYPGDSDGIHFLYLGRIMKEKGVDELFEVASRLKQKYQDRIKFDLVGFYEDEYKSVVDDLTYKKIINNYGFQTDPKVYYNNSHCVILPSYHEGMSNVLLEAASTGRPIITSDIPGCKEAVDDKVTGFLCKKQDSNDLEDKIEQFLLLSYEEKRQMGIEGRAKMEREFKKELVVNKTIEAILR